MLQNISRLEQVIDGRVYQLICDADAPINGVRAAIDCYLQYLDKVEETFNKNKEFVPEQPQEEEVASASVEE